MFLRSISADRGRSPCSRRRTPQPRQTAAQGALLERALDAATAGDWQEAETLARRTGSKVAADLVTWVRLRDGAGNWDEYQRFLELHADWPGLDGDAPARPSGTMPSGQDPAAVFAFFGGELPQTGTGSLRLAEALSTSGREDEAGRRDRPRLARVLDDRPGAAGGDGALEGGARAAPRGAARHAALARADRRGAGDAAAGRRRRRGAGAGAHRGAPRRGGAAVPDQPGAGGAARTIPASPSSATSTASTSGAGRRPRTICARSRPRPKPSAGPSSGWSGGRTWRGRRSRTGRSRRPTRSPPGTSAAPAPTTPTPSGSRASSR